MEERLDDGSGEEPVMEESPPDEAAKVQRSGLPNNNGFSGSNGFTTPTAFTQQPKSTLPYRFSGDEIQRVCEVSGFFPHFDKWNFSIKNGLDVVVFLKKPKKIKILVITLRI